MGIERTDQDNRWNNEVDQVEMGCKTHIKTYSCMFHGAISLSCFMLILNVRRNGVSLQSMRENEESITRPVCGQPGRRIAWQVTSCVHSMIDLPGGEILNAAKKNIIFLHVTRGSTCFPRVGFPSIPTQSILVAWVNTTVALSRTYREACQCTRRLGGMLENVITGPAVDGCWKGGKRVGA